VLERIADGHYSLSVEFRPGTVPVKGFVLHWNGIGATFEIAGGFEAEPAGEGVWFVPPGACSWKAALWKQPASQHSSQGGKVGIPR